MMKHLLRASAAGIALLGLSGCAITGQGFWIPDPPMPAYVSPIAYEGLDCNALDAHRDIYGDMVASLTPVMDGRDQYWDAPVGHGLEAFEDRGLTINPEMTVYDAFVLGWGRYEAVMSVAERKSCGLPDTHDLLPWHKTVVHVLESDRRP
ncbi:hypothetical protein [Halomonas sp. I5-271120]|uniref:hypothetical protein n=1 Tax=Halomonas sp. I5-271120 TaxID=3061632 RepID=UPI0027145A29|nr:hypothetical protein [Halomonas sp. I5-271120]